MTLSPGGACTNYDTGNDTDTVGDRDTPTDSVIRDTPTITDTVIDKGFQTDTNADAGTDAVAVTVTDTATTLTAGTPVYYRVIPQ